MLAENEKEFVDGSSAVDMVDKILGRQKNEFQMFKGISVIFEWDRTTDIFTESENKKFDPCFNCPNNPKNGGSGICNCTLPYIHNPVFSSYQYNSSCAYASNFGIQIC